MDPPSHAVAQLGLPAFVPDLIAFAGTLVLVLILTAVAGILYRHFTGGIEWPDQDAEEDRLRRGGEEDEWEYY